MRSRTLYYGAAIAVAIILSFKLIPWATSERPRILATPSFSGPLGPAYTKLKPGARACISPVPVSSAARFAQFLVLADGQAQPLTVFVSGPGFSARGRVAADYPAGVATGVPARLDNAPGSTVTATVCVRNDGDKAVRLGGSGDSTAAESTLDGKLLPTADLSLTILGEPSSTIANAGKIVDRAAAMAALPRFVVWLIVLLALVAVPITTVVAVGRTLDD